MAYFILRRLLALIPTLLIASIIVFSVVRFVPGDVLDLMLQEVAFGTTAPETRAALEAELGLDKPVHVQYIDWLTGVFRGDLGQSLWRNTSVTAEIGDRAVISVQLTLWAMLFGLIIAAPVGIYSAIRQETGLDYLGRGFSILALSVPNFWVGTLVVILPAIWWGWTPTSRIVPFLESPLQNMQAYLIPALVLGTSLSGAVMRMVRTMMLETLRQDYIRTAWAKGLRERTVVLKHAVKNAMIPVLTLIGLLVPSLFSGSIVVEQIFRLPGMGELLLESVNTRDYPIIVGLFLVTAVVVVLVNLVVDLCYGLLDPKVRQDG